MRQTVQRKKKRNSQIKRGRRRPKQWRTTTLPSSRGRKTVYLLFFCFWSSWVAVAVVAYTSSSSFAVHLLRFMSRSRSAGLSGLCPVTEYLYLSNSRAAGDSDVVSRCKITCIINVSMSRGSFPSSPAVEYLHIPLADSPLSPLCLHFDPVSDKIQYHARGGGRTLVHCNAGVSRSATLCIAYLMKYRGMTLLEAHAWVKSRRPMVRPNNGFWMQLVQYEMQLRGCNSVHMVSSSIGEIPDIYEEEIRNMVPL